MYCLASHVFSLRPPRSPTLLLWLLKKQVGSWLAVASSKDIFVSLVSKTISIFTYDSFFVLS
jgi:hypothetical protein